MLCCVKQNSREAIAPCQPTRKRTSRIILPPKRFFNFRKMAFAIGRFQPDIFLSGLVHTERSTKKLSETQSVFRGAQLRSDSANPNGRS
jgi:hypothetical protein